MNFKLFQFRLTFTTEVPSVSIENGLREYKTVGILLYFMSSVVSNGSKSSEKKKTKSRFTAYKKKTIFYRHSARKHERVHDGIKMISFWFFRVKTISDGNYGAPAIQCYNNNKRGRDRRVGRSSSNGQLTF